MIDLGPGAVVADRYAIEALIGSGGAAMVYRVRDVVSGRAYALKVVRQPEPVLLARLVQEGRLQRELRHPHVVHVEGTLEIEGHPALLMELVQGPSLAEVLQRQPLSLAQVDWIAEGLLRGVTAAHRHGVTHRDLKPANVLLAMEGGVLCPKITDFGIAKVIADGRTTGHTRSGTTLGTPSYMAPEQVRDPASVDARADLWSVGTLLYEMIAGQRAFGGDDPFEVYRRIEEGRFISLREWHPDLPGRMERAILAALAPDRLHRVGSATELHGLWRSGDAPPTSDACARLLGGGHADDVAEGEGDEAPTTVLPDDSAAPVSLAVLPPPVKAGAMEGETTMIVRVHREYGIVAAVAAFALVATVVVLVGGAFLLLLSAWWHSGDGSGPSLGEGMGHHR